VQRHEYIIDENTTVVLATPSAADKKPPFVRMLEKLLAERKAVRKLEEAETDPSKKAILDCRQLSRKVSCNSAYGLLGAKKGYLSLQELAALTTFQGRQYLEFSQTTIENRFNGFTVAGDSIAHYTPVYVQYLGMMHIVTVESLERLFPNTGWILDVTTGKELLQFTQDLKTWSEQGWTNIQNLIRHGLPEDKKMMRVLTHTGLVDVTEDHSLLNSLGQPVKPSEVKIGSTLLHADLPPPLNLNTNISIDEARIMGFFFGDGSCGVYDCPSGVKASWALNNKDPAVTALYKQLCETVYPNFTWVAMPTLASSGVTKLVPKGQGEIGSIKAFVIHYRRQLYHGQAKVIPQLILHGSLEVRESFLQGLYDADGSRIQKTNVQVYPQIDQKNQISAAHIYWLAHSLGNTISLNTRSDKLDIFRIR